MVLLLPEEAFDYFCFRFFEFSSSRKKSYQFFKLNFLMTGCYSTTKIIVCSFVQQSLLQFFFTKITIFKN